MKRANLSGVSLRTLLEEVNNRFSKEQIAERKAHYAQCRKVELPDWFNPDEYQRLEGDAGKASSEWFQVFVKKERFSTQIVIYCPEFLRGPLSIDVYDDGKGVGGSY
jgi:hypothetical protein